MNTVCALPEETSKGRRKKETQEVEAKDMKKCRSRIRRGGGHG
jgi:hypothetical protein